jgi:phage terminase large subunit
MNLLLDYLSKPAQHQLQTELLLLKAAQRQAQWPGGWVTRDDGKAYEPNTGQLAFHDSPAPFRALFGGRGSGKTAAGAQEAIRRISLGLSGSVLNPDFENFKYSTWPELKRWIPWDKVIPADRRMASHGWEPHMAFALHFTNGAVMYCKGLKNPDAARGPNLNWLWYDEAGRDRTGAAWQLAIAGVRIGPAPAAWITTTPRGTRHWTAQEFAYKKFSEDTLAALALIGLDEGDLESMYDHSFASIEDNIANLDPMFYARMRTSYQGKFAQQELQGAIVDITEGLVYDNFGPDNITTDADYTPGRGEVELAYDDGFSTSPRVLLMIQRDGAGNVYVFDEVYHYRHQGTTCIAEGKEQLLAHMQPHAHEWARQYGAFSGAFSRNGHELPDLEYNDTWKWQERAGYEPLPHLARFAIACGDPSAAQFKDALRKADIPARTPKKSTVREGIKRVYALVRSDDELDEDDQLVPGRIRTFVHPRCKNFIREFSEGYRYPEGGGDVPIKADDHCPDGFRYWVDVRMRRAV